MKKGLLLSMTVLLVASMVIVACSPKPEPAATPAKVVDVVVGTQRDVTGPVAAVVTATWNAFDWYLKWLQQNDPIPGVNVKIVWEDTAYSADRYLPAYKNFKQAGAVLMIHTSSTATSLLGELNREDKIPAICRGLGYLNGFFPTDIKGKGPSYLFFDDPPYADSFATGAMYFMKQWKDGGYKGKPKAVFTGWDAPYPKGPIAMATPYLREQGFEMLTPEIYAPTTPDLSSQCQKLKNAGANLIMSNVTEKFFSLLLKDAQRAGMNVGIGPDKVTIIGGSETQNATVLNMAGAAAEGCWSISSLPNFDRDDLKGIKITKDLQTQNLGKIDPSPNYLMGVAYAHLVWGVVRKTADKYGRENITSDNIYKTLTELKNYDMMGLHPSFTYGPYERRPIKKYFIHAVNGGKWTTLTPNYVDLIWLIPNSEEAGLPGYKVTPEK